MPSPSTAGKALKAGGKALERLGKAAEAVRVLAAGGGGGGSQTKRGTRRNKAKVSGFRSRKQTPGGREVLRRRRKKGRKVLCPAQTPRHWNKRKRM